MERHLDVEINVLKEKLLKMAGLVEAALDRTVKALTERDITIARGIIEDDKEIDELEIQVENHSFTILARHQPVASDLRFIMACVKISNDLERMGDQAVNIAQQAIELLQFPPLKPLIDLPYMAGIVQKMVKDSLDALIENNVEKAKEVCRSDDIVDGLEVQIIRELTTYMIENPKVISQALGYIMVAKNLERIADLSTNIGEEVIFIVDAKTIKHHFEEI